MFSPKNRESYTKDFEKRTQATLQWLDRSIQATGYQGSAAYFHLWKGWSPAYTETTGYIIETLFNYAAFYNNTHYKHLAITCADWLCKIQNEEGAFPGGVGVNGPPVVFDTGQILFGLTRAFQETGDTRYQESLKKAVLWLLGILEKDGSWLQYAYVPGYVPTYYTRVVWAVLQANQVLNLAEVEPKMQQALRFYYEKVTSECSVNNWGFRPGEPAFTHTIAYIIRGFLESGHLLQNDDFIKMAVNISDKIIQLYNKKGKLAGQYDKNWQRDYSFTCVTGNAQLVIILGRLYQLTGETTYRDHAQQIFQQTFPLQWLIPWAGLHGAVPGSAPLWGDYQRFKFPNWAAKFYLDAYLLLHQIS